LTFHFIINPLTGWGLSPKSRFDSLYHGIASISLGNPKLAGAGFEHCSTNQLCAPCLLSGLINSLAYPISFPAMKIIINL